MHEKPKLIFLVFAHSVKKCNVLKNETVVNDHVNLLHFDERSVYFE